MRCVLKAKSGLPGTRLRRRVCCLVVLAVLAAAGSLASLERSAYGQNPADVEGPGPTVLDSSGMAVMMAMQQRVFLAIEKAEQSVVAIARVRKNRAAAPLVGFPFRNRPRSAPSPLSPEFVPNEYGAGVVIGEDGLILTTAHVLGDVEENDYYVWLNRKPFFVSKIRTDPWWDLAVLKVTATDLKPISFAKAGSVRKGEFVIALGNPYAIARDGVPSVSWGMVSNIRRRAPKLRDTDAQAHETLHESGTLIQTDTRLEAGYSGGALLNLNGEMIGLNTSLAGGFAHAGQAGLAIPVDKYFLRAVDDLRNGRIRSHGFLGVQIGGAMQGRPGVPIVNVDPTSSAFQAGLRNGSVVTHVDGDPVHDGAELVGLVSRRAADEYVVLTLMNASQRSQIRVQLAKRPNMTSRKVVALPESRTAWRGMRADYLSSIRQGRPGRFESAPARIGVLSVERDSPAWRAGLRSGQGILQVEETQVDSPSDFERAVAQAEGVVRILGEDGKVRSVPVE